MNFPFHFSINKPAIAILLLNIYCPVFSVLCCLTLAHLSPSKLERTVSLVPLQKEPRLVAGEVQAVI